MHRLLTPDSSYWYKNPRKLQALQFILKSFANWSPRFTNIWLVNVTFFQAISKNQDQKWISRLSKSVHITFISLSLKIARRLTILKPKSCYEDIKKSTWGYFNWQHCKCASFPGVWDFEKLHSHWECSHWNICDHFAAFPKKCTSLLPLNE